MRPAFKYSLFIIQLVVQREIHTLLGAHSRLAPSPLYEIGFGIWIDEIIEDVHGKVRIFVKTLGIGAKGAGALPEPLINIA